MVAEFVDADGVFFDEWFRLGRVTKRSVQRAAELAAALDVPLRDLPSLVVVGSKGKATAATYASAVLTAAGLRVGTITSPPIVTNRERIRVNGVAIDTATYSSIASRVLKATRQLKPATAAAGYLSPAGTYMVAGLDHLRRAGCEAFVVEAGMGGRSDEVSLLNTSVLAVTPIFGEHLGILGDSVSEIAEEKLAIATSATRVVSAVQSREVDSVLAKMRLHPVIVNPDSCGLDAAMLPYGLGAASAATGFVAASVYVGGDVNMKLARRLMSTIRLPGRLTAAVDGMGRRWLADAAIDAAGVEQAVGYARQIFGGVEFVLVSLPDGKDIGRTAAWLDRAVGAQRWLPVVPPVAAHLSYATDAWRRPLVAWKAIDEHLMSRRTVVAVGSWSFMSAVLSRLGVDNERAFDVSPCFEEA